MSHESIALALTITKPTLEKHYAEELATGANVKRMEVLEKLFGQAKKGSTSAARAYLAHSPEFVPLAAGAEREAAPVAKPEPKGKKEKAKAAAVGAENGTSWEDVLPAGNVVSIR